MYWPQFNCHQQIVSSWHQDISSVSFGCFMKALEGTAPHVQLQKDKGFAAMLSYAKPSYIRDHHCLDNFYIEIILIYIIYIIYYIYIIYIYLPYLGIYMKLHPSAVPWAPGKWDDQLVQGLRPSRSQCHSDCCEDSHTLEKSLISEKSVRKDLIFFERCESSSWAAISSISPDLNQWQ